MNKLTVETRKSLIKKNIQLRGVDAPSNRYPWLISDLSPSEIASRVLLMFKCSTCEKDYRLLKYNIIYGNKNTRDCFEFEGKMYCR